MPGVAGKGGQKGRSGRKSKAEEMGLTALLDECVSDADRRALFRKLLAMGKKGDVKASGLLLGYIYGKPVDRKEITGEDGGAVILKVIYERARTNN